MVPAKSMSNGLATEFHDVPELTTAEIANIGERVAATTNQFISSASPMLSAALPTGERIQVILPPASPDGGAISIRKQVGTLPWSPRCCGNLALHGYGLAGGEHGLWTNIFGKTRLRRRFSDRTCRLCFGDFVRDGSQVDAAPTMAASPAHASVWPRRQRVVAAASWCSRRSWGSCERRLSRSQAITLGARQSL